MVAIRYNLRSLLVRKGSTAATAFGVGLVVFVLAAALMLAEGVSRTFARAGHEGRAVVLRRGADSELVSSLPLDTVRRIVALPGIKADEWGPLAAGEVVLVLTFSRSGDEAQVSNVAVRGISPRSLAVHSEVHLADGRLPQPGTNEVMIGKGLLGRFIGLTLGGHFEFKKNRAASVVGVFEAAGSSFESEVWADADVLRSSFGREGLVSAVTLQLEATQGSKSFQHIVENDKQLGAEAFAEDEYYARQSYNTSTFVRAIGLLIAVFLSGGAIIGGAITMHTSVAQRTREIGTLRALGFSRRSVLGSFLVEAVVLSLFGSILGILGSLAISFVKISMMNFATWQEVAFEFVPEPSALTIALACGMSIGILGGLFPALRAASVPPVDALRG